MVRHTGLDVSVDSSDRHRASGYLTRQGPPTLRWALFEAGMCASRHGSPDHRYYTKVKERHDGKLAAICVARLFARRCYHILRNLDPEIVYNDPRPDHRRLRRRRHRPNTTSRVPTAVNCWPRRARQPRCWTAL